MVLLYIRAMEWVNDYITLSVTTVEEINSSYCHSFEDESYLYLSFGLFSKDCLFDLTALNYQYEIRIARTYLEKYNESLEWVVSKQSICCNTQSKLLEINQCTLSGIIRKVFLESTILYLLFQSQRNSLIFQSQCENCAILNKPIELEKINSAKKYILEHLSESLTIPILAGYVGANQCYLKKGFKEVFGQTIFEFIQEHRMVKARHLLQQPFPVITEISYAVGYSSLSSFSQAYKNYFGISPTDQLRQFIPNN